MVTTASVLNLVNSNVYTELAKKLAVQADINLLDFDEDMIQLEVSSVEKSRLTVAELTEVLHGMSNSIEYFINLKNAELFAENDVEDYPAHMEGENSSLFLMHWKMSRLNLNLSATY